MNGLIRYLSVFGNDPNVPLPTLSQTTNPKQFESINAVVRNNIVAFSQAAGINMWSTSGTRILHNTLWNTQEVSQNAILINAVAHSDQYTGAGYLVVPCENITIVNNIMTK